MKNLRLQNIIFPSTEICTVEEMYFRRSGKAEFSWAEKSIYIKRNSTVHLDTYFNGFSVAKWKKYTQVENVYITLKFEGKMRITLVRKERTGNDGAVLSHYIKEVILESRKEGVTLCFDDMDANGIYAVYMMALSNSVFYGGYYSTDLEESQIQQVKLALDICTFKREQFIKRNLKLIKSRIFDTDDYIEFKENLEIFIVDNAGTLDKEAMDKERLHILYNKNVGGTGGFTRGMIEIKKAADTTGITHALLMDDDIVVDPETLFRTWVFLSALKDEYKDIFVAGAMMRLDYQNIQVEAGAVWNQGELIARKSGLDLRTMEACLFNEIEETIDYSAWWYTVLPISVIRDDNLPIPIFIRGDDVEYGLRNARNILTMNGICVWHEPFENKYSSAMFYYILRNRLIDNAIHGQALPKKVFLALMGRRVREQVYLYRYKNADLLLDGVIDYLRGLDWLKGQDGEEMHKRVMEKGYRMQFMEEMGATFDFGVYESSFREPEILSFTHRVRKRLTINGITLKPKRNNVVIPVIGGREITVYRAENVVHYDANTQKGFITRRDKEEAKGCLKKLKEVKKLADEKYEAVNLEYRTRGRELMNIEFWNQYLS